MKSIFALALGVVTLVPVLYFMVFVCVFVMLELRLVSREYDNFTLFALIHVTVVILNFMLIGLYLLHAHRNTHLSEDKRTRWLIAILIANVFAMPIYWYKHMRPAYSERIKATGIDSGVV